MSERTAQQETEKLTKELDKLRGENEALKKSIEELGEKVKSLSERPPLPSREKKRERRIETSPSSPFSPTRSPAIVGRKGVGSPILLSRRNHLPPSTQRDEGRMPETCY